MPAQRKRSGFGRFLLLLLVLGGGGAAAWHYLIDEATPQYDIQTVHLSSGSIERSVSATGSVQALVTVDISSQLSGQMSKVNVDFNSKVSKSATLAVIDPRTFEAKVASAEANLAIAKTNLELQQANIAKAQALVEQAERTVARQRELAARNVTSDATLETSETQLVTAKADLDVAKAELANAKATIAQREADLAQAKLDLARTELTSPIDGVVIARNIDEGGTVAASLQAPILFQIAQDLSQIEILALVDEADIGAIEAGNDVTFTVDAFPDQVFTGSVGQVRIAGTTTNNVVTYTVVVRAENPRQRLLPGMTATVRIITGTRRDVLRVPNEAVRFTPPAGLEKTEPAERPNRDDAIVTALSENLKMTPEQTAKFAEGLAATRVNGAQRQARGGNGSDAPGTPQGSAQARSATSQAGAGYRQGRIQRVLEGILTEEQMKTYIDMRAERREKVQPALLWVRTPEGLQPRRVLLGLSDESFSEILRGDLKEGDSVVTRARPVSGSGQGGGRRRPGA